MCDLRAAGPHLDQGHRSVRAVITARLPVTPAGVEPRPKYALTKAGGKGHTRLAMEGTATTVLIT